MGMKKGVYILIFLLFVKIVSSDFEFNQLDILDNFNVLDQTAARLPVSQDVLPADQFEALQHQPDLTPIPEGDSVTFSEPNGVIPTLPDNAIIKTALSAGNLQGFTGSNVLLQQGFPLEGIFHSVMPGNILTIPDLVDESFTSFILDKNQEAQVQQFDKGLFSDKFRVTLSKGATMHKTFRNSDGTIIFHATDNAAFFEELANNYQFSDGTFIYSNKKIKETITTTQPSSVYLDINTGVICVTLAQFASYSYADAVHPGWNFTVVNKDRDDYKLCIRKRTIDTFGSNYVDLIAQKALLGGMIIYSKAIPVYTSLSKANAAVMTFNQEGMISQFNLFTTARGIISTTQSHGYIIKEQFYRGSYLRYFFVQENQDHYISNYLINVDTNLPITLSEDGKVQQVTKTTKQQYTALEQGSAAFKNCAQLLEEQLQYRGNSGFYEDC